MRDLTEHVNAVTASREVGVTAELIRLWRFRGLLEPADYDERGYPLYRLLDVFRCERDTRQRQRFTRPEARRQLAA